MIPLTLQIKNFLSYGPELQTIDFASYPLICLSGKNGHGKSALLDAITWALWGQARKIANTAKADQGLLHLGQTIMMVSLDFECNGQLYRIKREYAQTYGKPYALLEFGIINSDNETVVPLTDKTIRATQHKIEQTLHLDFDAFINSAFLRQGQSNEFSKKSPKDRKEILASILGLNRYELIKKLAMEKSKHAIAHKATLAALQQKYELDLQAAGALNENLLILNHTLEQVKKDETALANQQEHLNKNKNQLAQEQKSADMIQMKHAQVLTQQEELRVKLRQLRTLWRIINRQQASANNYQEIENNKKELSTQLTHHQTEIQKLLTIKEEYLSCKETASLIEQKARAEHTAQAHAKQLELQRLQAEQTAAHKTIAERSKQQEQWAQEKKIQEKNKETLAIELLKTTAELIDQPTIEKQFERRKEYYHRFIAQGNAIKTELDELEQKQQLVHDDNDPSCPLCEQNLSASRKRFLKSKFEDHKEFLTHRFARLSTLIKRLKELLIKQHAFLEQSRKNGEQQNLLQLKLDEIEKIVIKCTQELEKNSLEQAGLHAHAQQLQTASTHMEQEFKSLSIFDEKKLQSNQEYQITHQHMLLKEKQTKALPTHTQKQQQLIVALQSLEQQVAAYHQLKEQIALQGQRTQDILNVCGVLKQLNNELMQLNKQQEQYKQLAHQELQLSSQQQQLLAATNELRMKKEQHLQEKGNLEAQKEKLTQLEQEYKEQQKTIAQLTETIDEYQVIAQATGKDGIQALLIEDAIPEIEQEANNILGKLTDNQAHIYIESLRDLKKVAPKKPWISKYQTLWASGPMNSFQAVRHSASILPFA